MRHHYFHNNKLLEAGVQFFLTRPQVNALLEKCVQKPLTTVIAGAGYGKTYAVYSFLQQYDAISIWLQLSSRDNQETRFWESFTHTVSLRNLALAEQLSSIGFPGTDRQFDILSEVLMNEIKPNEQYIAVFDDLFLIHEKSILAFLEKFAAISFPNLSLIFISRNEPDINIIRLLSKGLVSGVDEEVLRFSEAEISQLMELYRLSLPPSTITDIYRDTEGWAFAVRLAGLSLSKDPSNTPGALTAMKNNIFKLIESEFFVHMTLEMQRFLVMLSLIDNLPRELMEELAPSNGMVADMDRAGSFIRYDAYLDVYRLHQLFLDFLEGKQSLLTESDRIGIYRRAAAWCIKNGYKMDAITYYEKSGDYQNIMDITAHFPQIIPDDFARMLLSVVERIPSALYESCQPDDTDPAHNAVLMARYALYARLLITLGRFSESVEESRTTIQKFEAMPASPLRNMILVHTFNSMGYVALLASQRTGNYRFGDFFKKAYEYYSLNPYQLESPLTNACISMFACRVGNPAFGEFERFIEGLSDALPYIVQTVGGCMSGLDDLARAELAFFRDDLKLCEQYAYQALYQARDKHQYEVELRAVFALLQINTHTGDTVKINELLKQLERLLETSEFVNRHTQYDVATGWFYLMIGQPGEVAHWLKNDFDQSDQSFLAHGLAVLVKAQYYLLNKLYHALLAFLRSQNSDFGFGGFLFGKITILIIEAICYYHLKDRERAFATFKKAYLLAEPNSLDMLFIEFGNEMRTLTDAIGKDASLGIPEKWLQRIYRRSCTFVKQVTFISTEYEKANHLIDDVHLSFRETEVLTDLYHGLSRSEIAASRNMSVNTVKSVLQMIYSKLGAENNVAAVRIALAKRLL